MDGFQVTWLMVSVGWVVLVAIVGAGVLRIIRREQIRPEGKKTESGDEHLLRSAEESLRLAISLSDKNDQ